MSAVINNPINRKLDVHEILTWLEQEGMVDSDNAHMLRTLAVGEAYESLNPLEVIADRSWTNIANKKPLTLEVLTEWLAERVELPYYRIDPLKIEVGKITEVMSYAYAERFNVIAVEVEDSSITVATAQPFDREWEVELSRLHSKEF